MTLSLNIKKLEIKEDERGWLVEIIKKNDLNKKEFGQIFVTAAYPRKIKGNHYHKRKEEWFCVIKGKGKLVLVDNETNERKEIIMEEGNLILVRIPQSVTHAIENIGKDIMYLLTYVNEEFDPKDPDTYRSRIL